MDKLMKILPLKVKNIIEKMSKDEIDNLTEIRMRVSFPIYFYIGKEEYSINDSGLSKRDGYIFTSDEAEIMWKKLCDGSPYSTLKNQKEGFITIDGNRVGFVGEYNSVDGQIRHIEKITSFCVRIMHEKKGCANKIYKHLYENNMLLNSLIVSPPGCGKTTLLRDITRLISFDGNNVTLIDEREEIAALKKGIPMLDIGKRCDVYAGISKEIAVENSVRSMKPDVIVLDEIGKDEFRIIENAMTKGVKIIATLHGDNFSDISKYKNLFNKFIFLSDSDGIGTIKGIYDNEGKECC